MRSELEGSGKPVRLSKDSIEDAILESASHQHKSPLEYLLGCWKRLSRSWRDLKHAPMDEQKADLLKEARRLCISYTFNAVNVPDIFGHETTDDSPLAKHMLADLDSEICLDHDFVNESIKMFQDDASVREAFVNGFEQLSRELSTRSMNDDYKLYVMVSQRLRRSIRSYDLY